MRSKLFLLLSLVFILILSSFVIAAESDYIYEVNTDVELKIACFDTDYASCNDNTNCTILIIKPNGNVLIDNENMSYNSNYFNYTIAAENLTSTGEYSTIIHCLGDSNNGVTSFVFELTPSGIRANEGNSLGLILIVGVLVLLIIIFAYLTKILLDRESNITELFFIGIFIFTTAALSVASRLISNLAIYNFIMVIYKSFMWITVLIIFATLYNFIVRAIEINRQKEESEEHNGGLI